MASREQHQLPSTNLLQTLSAGERERLFRIGTVARVEKNALIFQAGAPSEYVYIILSGRAKIYELSPQGKEVIMWFCFTGELFGLAEVWRGTHRDVFAQACTPVELVRFDHKQFRRYLMDNPSMAMQVIDILSGRLRVLGDMLLNLTSTDVTARLVKLLARFFQRYGRSRNGRIYIDIPLTHQEMADMIGCCRQTVTSTLGVLKRTHGLRTDRRMLYMEAASSQAAAETLVKLEMDLAGSPR
ncbi:MAG: Crp/Fnr family transcriptional regulator [Gammaproteobacteria bacterium]|nr:Crp/Fnr family transcriptional regulator [Gammaproteobacteria bacterium]MXX16238.1 Crp/Fnr family transcriptional regulator [Gammaproteobacteria bacterium]MXY63914.1 Crp/Fnr family transcriptional regulator [Gammaproteobacteria bacterium]MYG67523.1 Crp/Fnr family transcriptional regulator [Gammaproteobacteria bacterium]